MRSHFRTVLCGLVFVVAFGAIVSRPALAQPSIPPYAYSDGHNLIVVGSDGPSHTVTSFLKTGDDPIESIAWKRDGTVVAFIADQSDASGNPTGTSLFITDGKNPASKLADNVDPIFPICFTTDGQIAFMEHSPSNAQVINPNKGFADLYFVTPKVGSTPQLIQSLSFDVQFGDGFNPILPLAQYKHEVRHVDGNYLTFAPVANGFVYTPSTSGIGLTLFMANLELPVSPELTRVSVSLDGKQVAGLINNADNTQTQIAVATLTTSETAKSTVKRFKTSQRPDQIVWGDANTIYYTTTKSLGTLFNDAELRKLNGLINANDSTPIDGMNNYQVSIRALTLSTGTETEVYASDPKPDSPDNSYGIARLSYLGGKIYFTSVPGIQPWAQGVLAGKLDVQTPDGLVKSDALFPLRTYQLDPATKTTTLVGTGLHHATFETPNTSTPPQTPATQTAQGQKSPIQGLIDRQHTAWIGQDDGMPEFTIANVEQFPGILGGIVINTSWNTLQPTQKGALDFSTIDNALALVRAYNSDHPANPLGVKLRVWAGANAPTWAKKIEGGPVRIMRNPGGCPQAPCPLTVGKFWSPAYDSAWASFQVALAAKYDSEPLIRQVAVTSCTQQTDEPFVPTVDSASNKNLVAAGYTDAAQQQCIMNALTDYTPWKTTNVDFSFNPFYRIEGGADPAFTISVMKACRATFGSRCILDNQALNAPPDTPDQVLYDTMKTLGRPIAFQTAGVQGFDCQWTAVIAQGVKQGAAAIEIWPEKQYQGFDNFTTAQLQKLAAEFTPSGTGSSPQTIAKPCSGFH